MIELVELPAETFVGGEQSEVEQRKVLELADKALELLLADVGIPGEQRLSLGGGGGQRPLTILA